MPNGNGIRPLALVAGIGTVGLVVYLAHRKHEKCTSFPDVYSKDGPIHLTPHANEQAREFIAMKLDNAKAAGIDIPDERLIKQAAEHITDCEWEDATTTQAQQILGSIGTIVNYMKSQQEVG